MSAIYEVFKTQGKPTITYVSREDGAYERELWHAISNRGTICLVTGPSKTGKTSLCSRVGEQHGLRLVKVSCDRELTAEEFWRRALEQLEYQRKTGHDDEKIAGIEGSGKISGGFSIPALFGLKGEAGVKASRDHSESSRAERVLARPTASHIVPLLRDSKSILLIEDFHYLAPDAQQTVFQQWKVFVDNELSVIIVGTTHHAADLAYANKDLIGRVSHVNLPVWKRDDLKAIAQRGFEHLHIAVGDGQLRTIADESVGLPIVTQAVCLELCLSKGVEASLEPDSGITLLQEDILKALHRVATSKFDHFATVYDRLTRGLRKKRKYNTYELVLSSFTLGNIEFSLTRQAIFDRLKNTLEQQEVPPVNLIAGTLTRLKDLQDRMGVELLEWNTRDERLYILEPSFLFFLRWRKQREVLPSLSEVIKDFRFGFFRKRHIVFRRKPAD